MRRGFGSWRDFANVPHRIQGPRETLGGVYVDWSPAVDVLETDLGYIVRAELPGASRDEVQVGVAEGKLLIWGERPWPGESDEGIFRRIERSYGSFLRQFTLPADADSSSAEAFVVNGILEVAILKLDLHSRLHRTRESAAPHAAPLRRRGERPPQKR